MYFGFLLILLGWVYALALFLLLYLNRFQISPRFCGLLYERAPMALTCRKLKAKQTGRKAWSI